MTDHFSSMDTMTARVKRRPKWSNDLTDDGVVNSPDCSMINGRPAEDWEQTAIMRARLAAREEAAALVR